MSAVAQEPSGFLSLDLAAPIQEALQASGYHQPTPIQAATIPHLLAGRDVLGQAQTGTGKTAAFALPLLSRIDLTRRQPQVLVLAPTRELAMQVSEAFERYAGQMPQLRVLAIYGGQAYAPQIQQLRRGVHVVVGTPGRVMDHMRQGTLNLEGLACLVLDEADEMLQMGFIEDVQWILTQMPAERQIALFSATMPPEIRRIAKEHLRDPQEVLIAGRHAAATIRQRAVVVYPRAKAEALCRILEAEPTEGVIVFTKTKIATVELSEYLIEQGFSAAALNGDMQQAARQRMVDQLKGGQLNVLVATDVAARGLDVERISHVINFDLPRGTEAYVHRIGRTGRAGRSGESILLVTPREQGIVRAIERTTKQPIESMEVPSAEAINRQRVARFKERITAALSHGEIERLSDLIEQYEQEEGIPPARIAAALATMIDGGRPMLLEDRPARQSDPRGAGRRDASCRLESFESRGAGPRPFPRLAPGMERFRLEVGRRHGALPAQIVGAIANEAGVEPPHIGRIEIFDEHSTVELPEGMPKEIFRLLGRAWVSGRQLRISREADGPPRAGRHTPSRSHAASEGHATSEGHPVVPRSKPPRAKGALKAKAKKIKKAKVGKRAKISAGS